jgi:hypothetical protein
MTRESSQQLFPSARYSTNNLPTEHNAVNKDSHRMALALRPLTARPAVTGSIVSDIMEEPHQSSYRYRHNDSQNTVRIHLSWDQLKNTHIPFSLGMETLLRL